MGVLIVLALLGGCALAILLTVDTWRKRRRLERRERYTHRLYQESKRHRTIMEWFFGRRERRLTYLSVEEIPLEEA